MGDFDLEVYVAFLRFSNKDVGCVTYIERNKTRPILASSNKSQTG